MTSVKVRFEIHYVTKFGEELRLVGSSNSLGNWNPQNSIALHWTDNHFWVLETNIAHQDIEYKYLVANGQQVCFGKKCFLLCNDLGKK